MVNRTIEDLRRRLQTEKLSSDDLIALECLMDRDDPRRRRMDRHRIRMEEIGAAIRGLALTDSLGVGYRRYLRAKHAGRNLRRYVEDSTHRAALLTCLQQAAIR